MEGDKEKLFDGPKTRKRTRDDENTDNSSKFEIYKRIKNDITEEDNNTQKVTKKFVDGRYKKHREKKKKFMTQTEYEKQKELSRQRSKKYRERKKIENFKKIYDVPIFATVKNETSIPNINENVLNMDNSQISGPSWLNVPFVQGNLIDLSDSKIDIKMENVDDSKIDLDLHAQNTLYLNSQQQNIGNNNLGIAENNNSEMNVCNFSSQTQEQIIDQQSYLAKSHHTYTSYYAHSGALLEFKKQFIDNDFGHSCNICDRLWFKKEIKILNNDDATPDIEFIRTMLTNMDIQEIKICYTCFTSIKKNKIPPISIYNGFKYPSLPDSLRNSKLDLVSERLISPRIPFMQIRRLRHVHGRFEIYGQVINIPIKDNTMVNQLPRNDDVDHSITVHIKRKKVQKLSYLNGVVNKRTLKVWLQYLITTPLYQAYDIEIDEHFLTESDSTDIKPNIVDNDIFEDIPIEESLTAQQQTLMWNDDIYLRIASGENNIPISLLFDEHAEELSFPTIYLGEFRHFRDGVSVTPFMMATSEIRRSDRRGVTPHHLLYMAMKLMRIRVRDSFTIPFKHVDKDISFTKEQIKDQNHIEECIQNNLAFLRCIPNSTWYWSERKKDLFAMIKQLGKPTVFFTISANEIGWPKLIQLLYKLKNNEIITLENAEKLHFMIKSTLINDDAVTCAIYFNKLVNVIIKILQSKKFSPFQKYRVSHYFKRIEFQQNGSPHAHILAWLDNAPTNAINEDSNDAIQLIDFLSSVSASEASGNIKLQTHTHTSSCYKKITSKKVQKCRFDAPFIPSRKTMILVPMKDDEDGFLNYKKKYSSIRQNLENHDYIDIDDFYHQNGISSDQDYINIIRAGINRPRVFIKRDPTEKWHIPFNPFLLHTVKSSMDFQFITEEYSCAEYIVEYVNKSKRGVSDLQRRIIETMDENPEFDVVEVIKSISVDILNHTEITSQEAAWYLLREPTTETSAAIAFIPTVRPNERQRIKKSTKELDNLEDDCTDIWKENWFDMYEKRPDNLEHITLAQFVSKYYKNKKGQYALRDEPRIIRYKGYDMTQNIKEYKREMVTLHTPFRNEKAEILSKMKFIKIYKNNENQILEKRKEFESNIDIAKMIQICRELCCEETPCDNDVVQDVAKRPPKINLFKELYNNPNLEINDDLREAMFYKLGLIAKKEENMSLADFCDLMRIANEKQQEFLLRTIHHLLSDSDNSSQIFLSLYVNYLKNILHTSKS